jgi:hypothetical protein
MQLFVSFAATLEGSESDVRFVYCACCICYILQDWSVINIESATNYIVNSIVSCSIKTVCRSKFLFNFQCLLHSIEL